MFIQSILLSTLFLIPKGYGIDELEPNYGKAPILNGKIDTSANEWNNASKITLFLFTNESSTDRGLPIDLWVMYTNTSLCISVQFELEDHDPDEFIGIEISKKKTAASEKEYFDCKIAQFKNLGAMVNESIEYLDYHLESGAFIRDLESNGDVNGTLSQDKVIYEFLIPRTNDNASQDTLMEEGNEHYLKIMYGHTGTKNYNNTYTIIKSNELLIDITYPPYYPPPPPDWITFACMIIFIGIAGFFGYYVYRIIILRKQMERNRG